MSETLRLTVLSPERRLVDRVAVAEVTLPSVDGQVQVLPGHAPMVAQLQSGPFAYVPRAQSDGAGRGFISTGYAEVSGETVTVYADVLELHGEIDLDRARRAQKKAEENLVGSAPAGGATGELAGELDEHHFRKYQLKLQRALIRQQVSSGAE